MIGTIQILDDDPAILELTSLFLEKHGFTTRTCASPDSALERFHEAGEPVTVLVADVTLAHGSGVEVALAMGIF